LLILLIFDLKNARSSMSIPIVYLFLTLISP